MNVIANMLDSFRQDPIGLVEDFRERINLIEHTLSRHAGWPAPLVAIAGAAR